MRHVWLILLVLGMGLGFYAGDQYGPTVRHERANVTREHSNAEEWRGKFNGAVSAAGEREIQTETAAAWMNGYQQYKSLSQYWRKQAQACGK